MKKNLFIGTSGWAISSRVRSNFSGFGPQLSQYAKVFNCAEINSSFYRDHTYETYAKWASLVPDFFRFSVKLSREFTQRNRLKVSSASLKESLEPISGLGHKLGVLLIQLPPQS